MWNVRVGEVRAGRKCGVRSVRVRVGERVGSVIVGRDRLRVWGVGRMRVGSERVRSMRVGKSKSGE